MSPWRCGGEGSESWCHAGIFGGGLSTLIYDLYMNANAGTQLMLLTISVRDYCTFSENQRLHLNSFNQV